jgi:hypothetical protein
LFLPFELGIHKAHIIFTDETVGEIQYTIIGKAELPEILDTFTADCASEVMYTFKKTLNYKNEKLEQARNQILEKDKKDRKKQEGKDAGQADATGDKAGQARKESVMSHMSNDPKQFEIEISNPFFSGSNLITLSDMTAPKVSSQANNKPSSKEGGRGS